MKSTNVIVTCDNCGAPNLIEFFTYEVSEKGSKKVYEIDLCTKCDNTFGGMLGRTVPAPKKAERKAPAKKAPNKAQLAKYLPCPECHRLFKNKNGLAIHLSRSHKK